jgi:hypothetical protein
MDDPPYLAEESNACATAKTLRKSEARLTAVASGQSYRVKRYDPLADEASGRPEAPAAFGYLRAGTTVAVVR